MDYHIMTADDFLHSLPGQRPLSVALDFSPASGRYVVPYEELVAALDAANAAGRHCKVSMQVLMPGHQVAFTFRLPHSAAAQRRWRMKSDDPAAW